MADAMPWDISDPFWDKIHPGMKGKVYHEVLLFRHAESGANEALMRGDAVSDQVSESDLTERGEAQAVIIKSLIDKLCEKGECVVLTSPQLRAVKTAPEYAVRIIDLRERNHKHIFEMSNGMTSLKETAQQFTARVQSFVTMHRKYRHQRKRTILVTHSLWIREYMRLVQEASTVSQHHFGNASITVVQFTMDESGKEHAEFPMVGSVMHLPKELRTGHHHALFSV